jgi:hypothetical protein
MLNIALLKPVYYYFNLISNVIKIRHTIVAARSVGCCYNANIFLNVVAVHASATAHQLIVLLIYSQTPATLLGGITVLPYPKLPL